MARRQRKTAGAEGGGPKVDLSDLGKAGEHFIVSATEMVVGTGFAIKGVKELLEKEEGRKFVCELPFKAVSKGFELVKKAGEEIKERRKGGAKGTRGKRSRKINVE
jgi:hypothetical protein